MNKLTKVGLSALCGSLAAISSANAGELTVTGGVDMSWMSLGGGEAHTGNPIGMGSNLTFKGSGELDSGWTFDLTVAMLNQDAYSSTAVNIDMLGLGKLNFNQGDSGNGIDAMDDKMPTAWEEPWGMGLGTGIQLVSGVGPQVNVQYTTPTFAGITVVGAVAPQMGAADANDKGNTTVVSARGSGHDLTINVNPTMGTEILSGLNLFAGAHTQERYVQDAGNDLYQGVAGITFDLGPIALGYARSGVSTGNNKTGSDVDHYRNTMYGIAFNINDDLSVSYGNHQSTQRFVNIKDTQGTQVLEVESFQIAYTMGGASIRYATTDVSNAAYQTTNMYDKDARVISVSLAF